MSKPIIVSTTGKAIEEKALRKFKGSLLGEVIHPSEERYQLARRLWSGVLDPRHPGMIVRCAARVDVARSVEFARSNELAVAVRAGGHSFTGDSFCDGGMVIDVSGMKSIEINTETGTARAEAGLTVGEFDRATQAFDLATVLGECSSVGIAGYTLGGGLGRLMGKHGAGCDNLLCAELIGADGKAFRASTEENADLFWAIRGGGGNFGIVTSLEYRLYRVGQILGGTLTYPISDTREVLTFLDDYMMSVPDELDIAIDIGNCGLMMSAPGIMEPIVSLALSYCGDLERGEVALRPLRTFRKPVADSIRVMPYIERQAQSDIRPLAEFGAAGGSMALECGFIGRLGAEPINTLGAYIAEAPAGFWIAADHYLHGAVCRPTSDHTAFGLRRPGYSTRILSAWREPNQADISVAWVKRLSAALKPFAGGAMYLNYLTEGAGDAGVRDAYGSNYERLAALKGKYDPTNFFSSNRNIEPRT